MHDLCYARVVRVVMGGSHGVYVRLLRRASVKADFLLLRGGVRPHPPNPPWNGHVMLVHTLH